MIVLGLTATLTAGMTLAAFVLLSRIEGHLNRSILRVL
jgi:hypothetical protein